MRTIEFRALTKYTKEWVFGDLIHGVGEKEGRMYILPRIINVAYVKTKAKPHELDGYEIDPETVGQFTGLHDIKGVKIFEGDLLSYSKKASLYENCPITIIGFVFYHNGKYEVETKEIINEHYLNKSSVFFGVQPVDWIHLPEFCKSEIIGNIHEGGAK